MEMRYEVYGDLHKECDYCQQKDRAITVRIFAPTKQELVVCHKCIIATFLGATIGNEIDSMIPNDVYEIDQMVNEIAETLSPDDGSEQQDA